MSVGYSILIVSWAAVALATAVVLFFVPAPYGRFNRPGWGPTIEARWGWMVMESTVLISFNVFLFSAGVSFEGGLLVFVLFWNLHYVRRSLVYPLRMRGGRKPMAISVVLMAIIFNIVNGYLNGSYLSAHQDMYGWQWLLDVRFILGALFFFAGYLTNMHSDRVLRRLRDSDEEKYKVPEQGLFRVVSSAHYFGEIIEWLGWACLTWSPAGAVFALWTCANLIPRALSHHRWYRKTFPGYPKKRKAVIPFVL